MRPNTILTTALKKPYNGVVLWKCREMPRGQISVLKSFYTSLSVFCFLSPFSGWNGTFGRRSLLGVAMAKAIWDVMAVCGKKGFAIPLLTGPCWSTASDLALALAAPLLWPPNSLLANDEQFVSAMCQVNVNNFQYFFICTKCPETKSWLIPGCSGPPQ